MKKIFYLYKSGTLERRDNSLILVEKNNNVNYIPIEQLGMIVCFAEVNLNKRVLELLSRNGICILFYNFYGNLIGRFSPKEYCNGRILVNQVNAYNDFKTRSYIARQVLMCSLKNMTALLKYYQKKGVQLSEKISMILNLISQIDEIEKIEQMLLIEAKALQIYYFCFDAIIRDNYFKFERRSRHPPENPLNAMLSYGYALLYGIYLSVLDRSSLMPQISFIHSLSKNSDSLQYDLADIMKPVVIDRLVIRLIRKNQISSDCFDYTGQRCFLNRKGCEVFIKEFDDQLKSSIKEGDRNYTYKSLISREVQKLSEYIKGNDKDYKPFIMRW